MKVVGMRVYYRDYRLGISWVLNCPTGKCHGIHRMAVQTSRSNTHTYVLGTLSLRALNYNVLAKYQQIN